MTMEQLELPLSLPKQKEEVYTKFYRTVSRLQVGNRWHVWYESGNNVIDRRLNKSYATKEEADAAIAALDKEIEDTHE